MTSAPGAVFRLIYRSHSRIKPDDRPAALADIFRVARASNDEAGITGALLITDHWFVQALEGEAPTVQSLYERISRDARHEHVTLIEAEQVPARVFSRWAMAQVSASGKADIPLEATEGHLHTVAGVPLTRDQTAVLKSMRDTIGADVV
ncbi:MAG: BLUF domain-containing protein [Blastococcus sp.]